MILYGHLVSDTTGLTAGRYQYPNLQEFDRLIKWWRKNGYQFVSFEDYLKPGEEKKILLTFDDGFKALYSELRYYLQREKIPFMIFIITDTLTDKDTGRKILGATASDADQLFLSEAEILDFKKDGTHIGFHTRSHIRITDSSDSADQSLIRQLEIPTQYKSLLSTPFCFAYPFQAPENFLKWDQQLAGAGFEYFFDTKGFRKSETPHFFRVSFDTSMKETGKNRIYKTMKKQLLQYAIDSHRKL